MTPFTEAVLTLNQRTRTEAPEHYARYETLTRLLSPEALRPLVPGTRDEIVAHLLLDENLNTIPLAKWDRQHSAVRLLVQRAGITSWSLSDTVCLLKHVAQYYLAPEVA